MMNKRPLICIIGASGTGKSLLAGLIAERFGWKQVASATDRPIRNGETDGIGHIFVDPAWFDQNHDDLVAFTVFDGHQYGVTAAMLDDCDVYVLDIPGIVELRKRYAGRSLLVIGLSAPENVRAERMKGRGDPEDKVQARLQHDRTAFPAQDLADVCDVVLNAADTPENLFRKVRVLIAGECQAEQDITDVLVYVPSEDKYIRITEGDGTNLDFADLDEGYVDYVYMEAYRRSGEELIPGYGGGMKLLKKPYSEVYRGPEDITQLIADAMDMCDVSGEYVVL